MMAARCGQLEIVRILVEQGANVNATEKVELVLHTHICERLQIRRRLIVHSTLCYTPDMY